MEFPTLVFPSVMEGVCPPASSSVIPDESSAKTINEAMATPKSMFLFFVPFPPFDSENCGSINKF